MTGIHDVFPADDIDSNDPFSKKKLKQLDGEYSTKKTILSFDFDGIEKPIWLEEAKRAHLLTVLRSWWPRLDMHSLPFLWDGDSLPHATKYFNQNHRLSTSSAILF